MACRPNFQHNQISRIMTKVDQGVHCFGRGIFKISIYEAKAPVVYLVFLNWGCEIKLKNYMTPLPATLQKYEFYFVFLLRNKVRNKNGKKFSSNLRKFGYPSLKKI